MTKKMITDLANEYGIDPQIVISNVHDEEAQGYKIGEAELRDELEDLKYNMHLEEIARAILDNSEGYGSIKADVNDQSVRVDLDGTPANLTFAMSQILSALSQKTGVYIGQLTDLLLTINSIYTKKVNDMADKKKEADEELPNNIDKTLWD